MALVKPKPTSAGRRSLVKVVSPELYKGAPYEPLLEKQSKNSGRNNNGRITVRHRGGDVLNMIRIEPHILPYCCLSMANVVTSSLQKA